MPRERYAEQGIELLLGTTVSPNSMRPGTVSGCRTARILPYDRLLLTVGGRARHLPIHGGEKALYLRTIEEARLIRGRLATARRVLCIGAGVIGLEIASSARARGAEVTVLEALPRAMGRSVSPEGAQFVETLHRDAGVALQFGVIVDAIEDAAPGGLRVLCRGGGEFTGDLVIAGVGMQRNLALAEAAGLALEGGIVVDELGRTSAPDVYAAGDVTAFHHPLFASAAAPGVVAARAEPRHCGRQGDVRGDDAVRRHPVVLDRSAWRESPGGRIACRRCADRLCGRMHRRTYSRPCIWPRMTA